MKENPLNSSRSEALVVCGVERIECMKPEPEYMPAEVKQATDMAAGGMEETPATETESIATLYDKEDKTILQDSTDEDAAEKKPFFMVVKTNLLYDATLVPNVGVEFFLGQGWSIGRNWMYAWWGKDAKQHYRCIYGGELEVRKHLGRKAAEKPLQGHHLGVYVQGLIYGFETGSKGYSSDFGYSVGAEYSYSLPVAKRLNIDSSISVGHDGGGYRIYKPEDDCYVYKETKQRYWSGPTRAEISFVWLPGHDNQNSKKGGTK